MSDAQFGAAVIGCGRMGAFTSQSMRDTAPNCWFPLSHAEAIAAEPRLSLTALVDPSSDAREAVQALWPEARVFADPADMLAEGAPVLASIATRTVGRADLIEQCLDAAVRALHVEKPLCNSPAELARLERRFADDGVFATMGALRRFLHPYRFALEKARDGSLGAMTELRVAMGPAPLYWTHPHSVDLALHAAGERQIESVAARLAYAEFDGAVLVNDPVIEHATIRFIDGFAAHITRAPGRDVHYSCASGEISVLNNGHELRIAHTVEGNPYPQHDPLDLPASDAPGGTLAPIAELAACLAGDTDAIEANRASRAAMIANQRVLFAIVQSHREGGAPVALDAVDPDMAIRAETGGKPA